MKTFRRITIVGGGLAGLGLGIALRRLGVPASVLEAGQYPRHRVCGEFICGRGLDVLRGWDLLDRLVSQQARWAGSARFFFGGVNGPLRQLPRRALCISRFLLDASLAREFCRMGGDLHERTQYREDTLGEGFVRASGRRRASSTLSVRWFGIKVHARAVRLEADLEMHVARDGYVGLCRLEGDTVNVCGLFRQGRSPNPHVIRGEKAQPKPNESTGRTPALGLLKGEPGSILRGRMEQAVFEERSFCAVAGLPIPDQEADEAGECRVGDALAMIPPVTGNGMSMAFESAQIAAEPLARFSQGACSWEQALTQIRSQYARTFARRLAWGAWLNRVVLCRTLQRWAAPRLMQLPAVTEFWFARTR
jgi:flavin-dependent dehydrogenase